MKNILLLLYLLDTAETDGNLQITYSNTQHNMYHFNF